MTMNVPHYMFYAPNISNNDIGTKMHSPHGYVLNPGPHGYIIMTAGQLEKAVINKEYEGMVASLCKFKKAYCLRKSNTQ